jgi:hypothetical protein
VQIGPRQAIAYRRGAASLPSKQLYTPQVSALYPRINVSKERYKGGQEMLFPLPLCVEVRQGQRTSKTIANRSLVFPIPIALEHSLLRP